MKNLKQSGLDDFDIDGKSQNDDQIDKLIVNI